MHSSLKTALPVAASASLTLVYPILPFPFNDSGFYFVPVRIAETFGSFPYNLLRHSSHLSPSSPATHASRIPAARIRPDGTRRCTKGELLARAKRKTAKAAKARGAGVGGEGASQSPQEGAESPSSAPRSGVKTDSAP